MIAIYGSNGLTTVTSHALEIQQRGTHQKCSINDILAYYYFAKFFADFWSFLCLVACCLSPILSIDVVAVLKNSIHFYLVKLFMSLFNTGSDRNESSIEFHSK